MPLIPSIAVGSSDAAVKHAILSSISYKEGAGAIAGIDTWEELTAAFNSRAIAYGTNKIVPFEKGSVTRPKINAMLTGLGLDANLDLYYDAMLGRAVASQAVILPSNLIADTHAQVTYVPDAAGASAGWVSRGVNVLSDGPAGLQTTPTRTNQVINNTANSGSGFLLTGTTLAANTPGDSPANDNNAKRVTQGAGASDSHGRSGLVCTADTYYVFTISFKYDASATWVRVVFSDNVANGWQCWVNLQTKTIGTVSVFGAATVSTPKIVLESGGWFRLELSGKCTPAVAAGTMATIAVNADGSNTRAAGTYLIWMPDFELGTYGTPPILTGGAPSTRTGNSPVISGLGSSLTTGVAGYIKVDLKAAYGSTANRLLQFTGSVPNSDNILLGLNASNQLLLQVQYAGGAQAMLNLPGPVLPGILTVAFAVSNNFVQGRVVGHSAIAADTVATYPALDKLNIGCSGVDDTRHNYQLMQKLGLKFGAQNQASFDAMYALAAAA